MDGVLIILELLIIVVIVVQSVRVLVRCYKSRGKGWIDFTEKDFHQITQIPIVDAPNGGKGRWVCAPELRRFNGYFSSPKKVYIVRQGESLPNGLVLVNKSPCVIKVCKGRLEEAKKVLEIDLLNHGYNALISA